MSVTIVQQGDCGGTTSINSGTAAQVLPANTGTGHAVVLTILGAGGSTPPLNNVTSVTSSIGTFVKGIAATDASLLSNLGDAEIWVCLSSTGAGDTVTVNLSDAGGWFAQATELSTAATEVYTGDDQETATVGSTLSNNVTPRNVGDFIISAYTGYNSVSTWPSSPFTKYTSGNSGYWQSPVYFAVATDIVTSLTTQTATWTPGTAGNPAIALAIGLTFVQPSFISIGVPYRRITQSYLGQSAYMPPVIVTGRIPVAYTRAIAIIKIYTRQEAKLVGKTLKVLWAQTVKTNKQKNAIIRTKQVYISKLNKSKITTIKIVQTNIAKVNKLVIKIKNIVQIRPSKVNKQKNWNPKSTQTQTVKQNKTKNSILRSVQVQSRKLSKFKIISIRLVQINIAKINKQKIWNPKSTFVQSIRKSKVKAVIFRIVQVSTNRLKKSITKYTKTVYVQKAGEIGTIFYRLISAAYTQTTRLSKSLTKGVRSNLTRTSRINKIKSTNIKADQIKNTRFTKQKQWNAKADQVQNIKQIKQKKSNLRAVQIWLDRLSKQKNTTITSITIPRIRLTKRASKNTTAAQVVSATVTRASHRRRGITSGITYTIGTSRAVTKYRQIKAVLVNTFRTNKGIQKGIRASSTNISFLVKPPVLWKFLIQFVTKITSFKSQVIEKPGHALPDPDFWDPNMIDPSTPSTDGLIYGNPDDDR